MNNGVSSSHPVLFSFFLSFLLVLVPLTTGAPTARAQTGVLTGTVVDAETGETLIGANVLIEGTLIGTATDLDGDYRITGIPVGTHSVKFSYIGFQARTVSDVEIVAGEVTRIDIGIMPEAYELEGEVVVEARAIRNNESALLKDRQRAVAVSDAISAEAISRSGSGDAAAAMTRVTGASVVGGKYVYIRGLGDRYTNTTLNGSTLPSADPDRKAFQLDLFPSSLLDNIVTLKTFTPDKSGNFSGGLVDVATKSFPDAFTVQFSASLTYDDQASWNDNFILYDGSGTDWLGRDDGLRGLPDVLKEKDPAVAIPNESDIRAAAGGVTNEIRAARADSMNAFSRAFNSVMSPSTRMAPVNQSFSGAIGGQKRLFGRPLGFTTSLSYGRKYSYYDDGVFSQWELTGGTVQDIGALTSNTYFGADPDLELISRADPLETGSFSNRKGSEEVNWGASGTLAYKPHPNHELSVTALRTQSGRSEATLLAGYRDQNSSGTFVTRSLGYQERSLQTIQAQGEHVLSPVTIEWKAARGENTQEEPDLRFMSSVQNVLELSAGIDTTYSLGGGNAPPPQRYFRDLAEDNRGFKLDVGVPVGVWNDLSARIQVGGAHDAADRTFRQRRFAYDEGRAIDFRDFRGDIESYFATENLGVRDTTSFGDFTTYSAGLYLVENSPKRANYDAERTVSAGYAMLELPLTRRLRLIGGARVEMTDIMTESFDTTLPDSLRIGELKQTDVLPSVNIVYGLSDRMNVRLAGTRTLARPTFRELAPFQSFNFVGGDVQEGNPTLNRTLITNFDLRWEWFLSPGELLAVSGFYKTFDQPIERVIRTVGEGRVVSFQNVDEARVYGAEFEARKDLDSWTSAPILQNVSVGGNLSLVHSVVDIPETEMVFIRAADPDAGDTRSLEGQSPYLVNLNGTYENYESGTVLSVYYTLFGDRLLAVTEGATPDIFEKARGDLDVTFSQRLPQNMSIKVSAKNLLGAGYREIQTFKQTTYDAISYSRSRTLTIGFSYEI